MWSFQRILPAAADASDAFPQIFLAGQLLGDFSTEKLSGAIRKDAGRLCDRLPAILSACNGPFALAIRTRGELFLARDCLGQMPLFHREDGSYALRPRELQRPGDTLSREALADYLRLGTIPAPNTLYREIHKLPAGHFLHIRDGKCRLHRYWNPAPVPPRTKLPFPEAAEHADFLLRQAISRCSQGASPLRTLLSGGIDSGLILAIARPEQACTIGFSSSRYDERHLASLVAQSQECRHITQEIDWKQLRILPRLLSEFGEPFGNASLLATACALRLASSGKDATVLCGDGGDELFGGYRRYQLMGWRGILGEWPSRFLGSLGNILCPLLPAGAEQRSRIATFRRTCRFLSQPFPEAYAGFQQIFSPAELALLCPDLPSPYFLSKWEEHFRLSRAYPLMQQARLLDIQEYLPEDGCTKLFLAGLEAPSAKTLCPLLDKDLLDFALTLPPDYCTTLRSRKKILCALAEKHLPAPLHHQPKRGFGVPIAEWMRGPMLPMLQSLPDTPLFSNLGISSDAIHTLLRQHQEKCKDNSAKLWALLCLAMTVPEHK